jgi:hypothetical protein
MSDHVHKVVWHAGIGWCCHAPGCPHVHEVVWNDDIGWFCRAPGCPHPLDFDDDPPEDAWADEIPEAEPGLVPPDPDSELGQAFARAMAAVPAPLRPVRWSYLAWGGVPGRDFAAPPSLACRERAAVGRRCRESIPRRQRACLRSHPPVAPPCPFAAALEALVFSP